MPTVSIENGEDILRPLSWWQRLPVLLSDRSACVPLSNMATRRIFPRMRARICQTCLLLLLCIAVFCIL